MGTRKDFFEMCRQFGHALSKTFASPDLVGPDTYSTYAVENAVGTMNSWIFTQESACIGHRQATQRVSRRSAVIYNALATGGVAFGSPGWGRLFASWCPPVRLYERGHHWTDLREIWYGELLWKYVKKVQIWLKSGSNFGHFTWRHKYFFFFNF